MRTLYCNTLTGLPDSNDVLVISHNAYASVCTCNAILHYQAIVGKVLKMEARCTYKEKAAVAYCNSQLGELRAEERRRVS